MAQRPLLRNGPSATLAPKQRSPANNGMAIRRAIQAPAPRWVAIARTIRLILRAINYTINHPVIYPLRGLSATVRRLEGYFKNMVDGGRFADEDRQAIAARFLWDINDDLKLDTF
jgi:hypothetical protein